MMWLARITLKADPHNPLYSTQGPTLIPRVSTSVIHGRQHSMLVFPLLLGGTALNTANVALLL